MRDADQTDVVGLLRSLSFRRITSVPRYADATDTGTSLNGARAPAQRSRGSDAMRAGLLAALTGAYSDSSPVAVTWIRPAALAPLEVYVGMQTSLGYDGTSSDEVPVLFPVGSRGRPIAAHEVVERLTALERWQRCPGVVDAHFVSPENSPAGQYRAPFEDYVAFLAQQAFAWLVLATPIATIGEQLEELQSELYSLRDREDARLEVERIEGRLRELSGARVRGLWRIHVLVGAPTDSETQRVAALLCSGSDLGRQPYLLLPGSDIGDLATSAGRQVWAPSGQVSTPFDATTDLLATIARPPEQEVPGVRLVTPPTFDVAPETPASGVYLGDVLDANLEPAGPIHISQETLNRHTFVCGATGSGKSHTVRALLEQLSVAHIPWLVIEPAKAEYARMAGRLKAAAEVARQKGDAPFDAEVYVLKPSDPVAVPASLNPLEPEPNFPLQTHVDLVRALFLAAFEADEPFPQVLSAALTRCYTNLGWELALGTSMIQPVIPRYPTLEDLQRTAKAVVEGIGYGREVTDNVRGFIDVRIGSLRLGTPGRFFEGGHPLNIGKLLEHNVIIEIDEVGSDEDKAFLIGLVLIRLVEHLRVRCRSSEGTIPLRHVTVVEEAHRLLKKAKEGSPAAHAVELFATLLAEIRAYGEGIIVAEQIPSKLLPDVVKNTALKVMHRLPAQDDRDQVGATMNLDRGQSHYVVTLSPGRAAVFADGMDRPLLAQMPRGQGENAQTALHEVPLTSIRSESCCDDCRAGKRCTFTEMVEAKHLATDAQVTLWIELIVVAHLTGMWPPVPDDSWVRPLVQRYKGSQRVLECGLGHCIQMAVDARYSELALFFQPETLEAHVREVVQCQLTYQPDPCSVAEVQFQAGPYRWTDVRADLQAAQSQDVDGPHPKTERWRLDRGLTLAGRTPTDQLASLARHSAYMRDPDATLYGVALPSRMEIAVDSLSKAASWRDRFREATEHLGFEEDDWPMTYILERGSR